MNHHKPSVLARVNPEVRRRANIVLDAANLEFAADGLQVGAFAGLRTVADERKNMDKGVSWLGLPLHSYHVWGLAVDFVFLKNGRWTWAPTGNEGVDHTLWVRLGKIIKSAGFEWGGDWSGKKFDGPHAQLPLMRVAQLQVRYHLPGEYIKTWVA